MTITADDIKLRESERLTDNSDGGGRMTKNTVVDNLVNNLFFDISRLDRVYGRVSLRLAYLDVDTDNVDPFLGAHAILLATASDPLVDVVLFTTGKDNEERDAARNFIESYVVSGPVSRYWLYDRQVAGTRTITLLARPTVAPPEIGEVYQLTQGEETGSFQQQFVRIRDVSTSLESFTSSTVQGEFQMRVFTCEIDQALVFDFEGYTPEPFDNFLEAQYSSGSTEESRVRRTSAADAAEYYGVKTVDAAITPGDLTIAVDSVFSTLVPTTQAESPLLDQNAAGNVGVITSSGGSFQYRANLSNTGFEVPQEYALPTAVVPGTFSLRWRSRTGALYVDNGEGRVEHVSGGPTDLSWDIDYDRGVLTLRGGTTPFNESDQLFCTYEPGAPIIEQGHTRQIDITIQNRQLVYTQQLLPVPVPGSVRVEYRALNRWNTLEDNGEGALVGVSGDGIGSGTINYVTGSLSITLAALPEVDTALIFFWGSPVSYQTAADITLPAPDITETFNLANTPVAPGTVQVVYTSAAGHVITSSDNGNGAIVVDSVSNSAAVAEAGDVIGHIAYGTGQVHMQPKDVIGASEQYAVDYDWETEIVESFTPNKDGNGFVTVNLTNTPVKPGSIRVEWETTRDFTISEQAYLRTEIP